MRLILLILLVLGAQPAAAVWLKAEGPGFVAYSRGSEADLRARMLSLQQFDTLARALTGIPVDPEVPPLTIYFVGRQDMDRFDAANYGGFYLASSGGIFAVVRTDTDSKRGLLTVLFHEYTHHLMFQSTRAAYPSWYVEGFAEYLSTVRFEPGFTEFGQADIGQSYQLGSGFWLPTKAIMTTPRHKIGFVDAFYAQSWALVHYLSRDPQRLAALNRYLGLLTKGDKPEPAFLAAFGFDMDELDKQLRRYVRGNRATSTRLMMPPPAAKPVTITTLPRAADTLLIPAVQLSAISFLPPRPIKVEKDDTKQVIALKKSADARERGRRAALLETVRQAAAKMPGDAIAEAVLAEAAAKLGDRAAAIRLMDAALVRAPQDAQLLYLRGITELAAMTGSTGDTAAAARKRARVWLTRANAARPDDYRILAAHAATYGTEMPDRAVEVLLRAAELAPQVASVQASAALVLARRGDREAAKRRLAPIAASPHGGENAVAAAALIAAFEKGETPAELPVELAE